MTIHYAYGRGHRESRMGREPVEVHECSDWRGCPGLPECLERCCALAQDTPQTSPAPLGASQR